jgi:hypothetical protein
MKRFRKIYRIPTLFALTLIAIALGLGITVDYFNTKQQDELRSVYAPKKLTVTNLSDTKATITWQTGVPATGTVILGKDKNLSKQSTPDLRDLGSSTSSTPSAQKYLSHFIPLSKLEPNTTYYYQIKSEQLTYPKDNPLTFKTGPALNTDSLTINQPLIGNVVDPNLQPLNDALIFLDIPGAAQLATITTTSGSFILPLKELRTQDLQRSFDINTESDAQLVIVQGQHSSRNQIKLPPIEAALKSLILGQDLDLRSFQPPPQATTSALIETTKYDLNNDQKINALDISVIVQSIGKLPVNPQADLNDDGQVNQLDLDLISQQIQ